MSYPTTTTTIRLGLPSPGQLPPPSLHDLQNQLSDLIPQLVGKHQQAYPPYSSPRVNGKPLFQWAKDGKLEEITIPTISIQIFDLQIVQQGPAISETRAVPSQQESEVASNLSLEQKLTRRTFVLTIDEFEKVIVDRISRVTSGDFRQAEIIAKWKHLLHHEFPSDTLFPVITFVAQVSSGTYIRSLAHQMGEKLQSGGVAFDIFRTQVGNYSISDAFILNNEKQET